jgi:hypothetical protein
MWEMWGLMCVWCGTVILIIGDLGHITTERQPISPDECASDEWGVYAWMMMIGLFGVGIGCCLDEFNKIKMNK